MIKLFKSNTLIKTLRCIKIPRIVASANYTTSNNASGENINRNESESTTHFGFETVRTADKEHKGILIIFTT